MEIQAPVFSSLFNTGIMRIIIIDDEKHSREGLAILLDKYCEGIELIASCADGKEGIRAIEDLKPDLIFLDIEMPGMNGFDMLENCEHLDFDVIFTTAYNEYAIQAIRHSALDYLLKPVNKNEMMQAVSKAKKNRKNNASSRISSLLHSVQSRKVTGRIAISTLEGLVMVDTGEIIYCESENNYSRIHLSSGKKIMVSKTLKKVEELLSGQPKFFRIHNSYLINLDYMQQYIKGDGGDVILTNGRQLPVSRLKRVELLNMLEKL